MIEAEFTLIFPVFLKRSVLRRVDLPAPLDPIMANSSPGSATPLTKKSKEDI
jgi:hypothetical protein